MIIIVDKNTNNDVKLPKMKALFTDPCHAEDVALAVFMTDAPSGNTIRIFR